MSAGREILSSEASSLLAVLVSESIAYGRRWWGQEDRRDHSREAWTELYEAGLTRSEMYGNRGITAEAVRLIIGPMKPGRT